MCSTTFIGSIGFRILFYFFKNCYQLLDGTLKIFVQEISSLVGDVRTEASEAETVAMVTATAEEEEPMQTDSQAGDMEASAASVLQVHVEASEAASQVHTHVRTCTRTHTIQSQPEVTNELVSVSDGVLRQRTPSGADVIRGGRR